MYLGAFTNDVIILGWGGLEKMPEEGECCAKDDVSFLYDFWEKFQTILFKKVALIIRKK